MKLTTLAVATLALFLVASQSGTSTVPAKDEKVTPEERAEMRLQLRVATLTYERLWKEYQYTLEQEARYQSLVARAAAVEPPKENPQAALENTRRWMAKTKKKLIEADVQIEELRNRLGDVADPTLQDIIERLDRIEKRLERIEPKR